MGTIYRTSSLSTTPLVFIDTFPVVQNPLVEGGTWVHLSPNWANLRIVGSPNRVAGTQSGANPPPYNDSYAYLSTTVWPASVSDYVVTATIYKDPTISSDTSGTHELEILLRVADTSTTARLYEMTLAFDGAYIQMGIWNGPLNSFGSVNPNSNLQSYAPFTGDEFRAQIVGSTMTIWLNGIFMSTATDTTWTSGQPGIGTWLSGGAGTFDQTKFCFTKVVISVVQPVVVNTSFEIPTNAAIGQPVGTVKASNFPSSWGISAGNPGCFAIDATGQITVTSTGFAQGSYTLSVVASNSYGSNSGTVTISAIPAATLPTGVTLQAIDGETMTSSTVMSNNYFSRNNLTAATNTSYNSGSMIWCAGYSWDDPRFFAIGQFYGVFKALEPLVTGVGMNLLTAITSDTTMTDMNAMGVWTLQLIPVGTTTPENAVGNYTAGFNVDETDPSPMIAAVPNATQDSRAWYNNQTWQQFVFGNIGGTNMATWVNQNFPTPNSTNRKLDIFSCDVYFMAGATDGAVNYDCSCICSIPMTNSPTFSLTVDQCQRGSHYGNMTDVQRSWGNGTNPTGIGSDAFGTSGTTSRCLLFTLVELSNGNIGGTPTNITAPQLNWAVWSAIIHGVRGISYFTTYYTDQSVIDQVRTTNALIRQMAPVINSPFALGYISSISPHGYIFPVYEQNWLNGGVEACAHWYNGRFYIFATTRNGLATSNTSVTFTLNSNVTSATVTVIGENRTLPISSHQFTDTFVNSSDVHLYKIS